MNRNKISLDALLLFILVVARVRIDTLADMVLPTRLQDVRHLVGGLFPAQALKLLDDWLTDPVSLLLISLAFALLLLYLLADLLPARILPNEQAVFRFKLILLYGVIALLVFGKAGLYIGLRHQSGPASYTHDGGVIQTEAATQFFLEGKNPYIEDYLKTPMAEWGIEYRTALYHYPYLPWTFLFSAPFYQLGHALTGWYDQRFVYLLLFALTLAIVPALSKSHSGKLLGVMVIGLNPIMANDVLFGQNDSFVLFWLILALWLVNRADSRLCRAGGLLAFGLACASKPTAWFLAPFFLLYQLRDENTSFNVHNLGQWLKPLWQKAWLWAGAAFVIILPWLFWDANAMFDDIWRWSAGTAATPYQIRGWGLSNFVLALQLVPDRMAFFPFWLPEVLFSLPVLLLVLWRQVKHNTISAMLHGYALLLLVFFYFSRFLNENYLGYLLAFFALAYIVDDSESESTGANLRSAI